jgi:predicted Rdx family selenoprotein
VVRILDEWEDMFSAVELVPVDAGTFDVRLDGELVFTKSMLGRYPEPEDVAPLIGDWLEAQGVGSTHGSEDG